MIIEEEDFILILDNYKASRSKINRYPISLRFPDERLQKLIRAGMSNRERTFTFDSTCKEDSEALSVGIDSGLIYEFEEGSLLYKLTDLAVELFE